MSVAVDLATWWAQGRHVEVRVRGGAHRLFVWEGGPVGAPVRTLLHGWPLSSWDWADVAAGLVADGERVVAPDLLGLGASAKGDDVPYDVRAQADAVEALWDVLGVTATRLVVHDVGTIVAQELLARRAEGGGGVAIEHVVWTNGSLDPSAYRPTDAQRALADPEIGPQIAPLVTGEAFATGLAGVMSRVPPPEVLAQHWTAMSREDGHLGTPRFLRYIADREADAARLVAAVRDATVPMRFVWGPDDPVSGAEQVAAIRRLRPDADVVELAGTGHSPHAEDPTGFLAAIRDAPT